MKTIIRNRYYLLRDKDNRILISHTPGFFQEKIKTLRKISRHEISTMVKESLPVVTKLVTTNPMMKDFWRKLPREIREDLTLSFYYHKYLRNHKVLNVETINWEKIPYFKNEHARLIKTTFDLRHPKQSVYDMIRTSGKHTKGLRCKNMHIAMDHIGDKTIYQAHWDTEMPTSIYKIVKHFIFDDILG